VNDSATLRALTAFAVQNIRRRPMRSLAVVLPLTLAMALAAAVWIIADGVRRDAAQAAALAPPLLLQRLDAGILVPFEEAPVTEYVRGLPEVAEVRGRVWALVTAPGEDPGGALATLMGWDPALLGPAPDGTLRAGRLPEPGETGVCVLGAGLATQGRLQVGSTWAARARDGQTVPLEVIGVFAHGVAIHTASLALAAPSDVRRIAGVPEGFATEVALTLRDGADKWATGEVLVKRFPELRPIDRDAVARFIDVIYRSHAGPWTAVWLVLLLVAPAVALALGFDVAASERREMGVLKALGWSSMMLIVSRIVEAALLGVGATALGAALGLGYAAAGAPVLRALFVGWTDIYPAFPLPLALEPATFAALFALGVLPLVAASALPAWRIGSQSPDAAMRA
jgi:predicted lysophospholipase L1 biosynthesis ABC-type transport system permease subunit